MSTEIMLGKMFELRLSAMRSAWIAFLAVWGVLAGVALVWLKAAPVIALMVGLAAALLHWLSDFTHQLGHAWAARRTGYPMSGIRFWGFLSTCVYPEEPQLPARVHIRRALGGPMASLFLSILAGLLVVLVFPTGGVLFYVLAFFFLDNFLVLTLGAFLPLGFTDGSTLLTWIGGAGVQR